MKAKSAIIALALIPASASAQPNGFEGFDVGLGLGYVQPKVTFTDNISGHYQWAEGDWVAQVDGAYHTAINDKWLIGVGLTFDLNNTNAGTRNETYGPVETTLKEHVAVYIQPTYVVDRSSAVFAKIGYHSVKVDAIGQPGSFWIDDKIRTQGIGYGFGCKKLVSKDFFVQAEIQFVDYEKELTTEGTGYVWDYQQKTAAGIFTVGYKF